MATSLERITGDTCIRKIRAMKMAVLNEEEEHCRFNCLENSYDKCVKYRPAKNFYVRIKGMKEYYA